MEKKYVEYRNKGYWIAGTRVSLDSIVYAFNQGLSPEAIVSECFPTLTLEKVYGTITYYLAHQADIDRYLKNAEMEFEALRKLNKEADIVFSKKLAEAKKDTMATQL